MKRGQVTSGQKEDENAVGLRLCLGQVSEQHLPSITQQKEPSKAARPQVQLPHALNQAMPHVESTWCLRGREGQRRNFPSAEYSRDTQRYTSQLQSISKGRALKFNKPHPGNMNKTHRSTSQQERLSLYAQVGRVSIPRVQTQEL